MITSRQNDDARWQAGEVGTANTSTVNYSARSTSTEAQIECLLEMVRVRPRHTHELRKMGISHPAGRIKDLKMRGYGFSRQLINTVDSDGYTHVGVALYSLVSEPERSDSGLVLDREAA